MREIKFRAWSIEMEEMYPVQDLHLATGSTHLLQKDGSLFRCPEHDVNLMQFTGLHDKNGKEIYEGDVVQRREPNPPQDDLRVVEWVNIHHINGWNVARGDMWEVIGNIYENPELIK